MEAELASNLGFMRRCDGYLCQGFASSEIYRYNKLLSARFYGSLSSLLGDML